MYYSKNGSIKVTVPQNYAGNAFYTDEKSEQKDTEKFHQDTPQNDALYAPSDSLKSTKIENSASENTLPFDISVEDLLLLGLIFVIYQSDPKDPTLIILLILLLVK